MNKKRAGALNRRAGAAAASRSHSDAKLGWAGQEQERKGSPLCKMGKSKRYRKQHMENRQLQVWANARVGARLAVRARTPKCWRDAELQHRDFLLLQKWSSVKEAILQRSSLITIQSFIL
jgi:hypothetical protein